MGHIDPTYDEASIQDNEPQYMEIEELQQPDGGFHNPHYQALNNAHERPNHVYTGLDFRQLGQTEV